eukprot:symbB.v1.2.013266.t1/scaffold879.1/size325971/13
MLHRVQFNIAGREATAGQAAEANDAPSAMEELIKSTDYFLEKGPAMVVDATRKAVQGTTSLQPETPVSTSSLSSFFQEVFQEVEKDIWADSKGSALLPPDSASATLGARRSQVERCGETWESQPKESAADAKSLPGLKFGSAPGVAEWLRQKAREMPEEDLARDELTEALLKVLAQPSPGSRFGSEELQQLQEVSGRLAELQRELAEQRDSIGAQKQELAQREAELKAYKICGCQVEEVQGN